MELSILHFKKCSTDYIDIFYSFLIMRAIHARVYKKENMASINNCADN